MAAVDLSYIADLLAGYKQINVAGVPVVPSTANTARNILNFVSGVTAVDNPNTGATDITVSGGASVTWANDLASSSSTHQYVSAISGTNGAGGNVALNGVSLLWSAASASPTIGQTGITTASATGATLTIQGQASTGTSGVGGAVAIVGGTGTATGGAVQLIAGSASTAFGSFQFCFGSSALVGLTISRAPAGTDTTFTFSADSGGGGAHAINWTQATTTRAAASNTTESAQSSSNGAGVGGNYIITPGAGFNAANAGYVETTDQASVVQMKWSNEGTVVPSGRPISMLSPASFQPISSRGSAATGSTGYINFGNDTAGVFMAHVLSNNISYKAISRNADVLIFGDSAQYTKIFGSSVFITDNATWTIGGNSGTQNTYINSAYHLFNGTNGVEALRFTVTSGGACTEQYAIGVTSVTIKQADQTAASTNGSAFTIAAQNATGATSTGANLVLQPGTGTTANGKLNLNNIITTTTVGAAGAASAMPTPVGYMNILVNGSAFRVAYFN